MFRDGRGGGIIKGSKVIKAKRGKVASKARVYNRNRLKLFYAKYVPSQLVSKVNIPPLTGRKTYFYPSCPAPAGNTGVI